MNSWSRAVLATLLLSCRIIAGTSSRDSLHSTVLDRDLAYVVILPNTYAQQRSQGRRFPVLYLLHCLGCRAWTYTDNSYCGGLMRLIDSVGFIAAAPDDGDVGSWWLDSPKQAGSRFSTFLVEEFKPRIDSLYATLPGKESSGLAGHSMGGFGSLHNLIEHPDVFGAALSIKGGLDPTIPKNPTWPSDFGFSSLLGTTPQDLPNWDRVNILKNIYSLKGTDAKIGFYSGAQDSWFHAENQRLHAILDSCGIPHTYWIEPETHYSIPENSMRKVIAFFDSAFSSPAGIRRQAVSTGKDGRAARRSGRSGWYNFRGQCVVMDANRGGAAKRGIIVVVDETGIWRRPALGD